MEERNLAILTDTGIEGHDAQLLRTFYALVLDWDARDAVGITPFLTQLERIESAETLEDLNALVLEDSIVSASIGGAYVSNSLAEPGMNTVYIDVPGLLLPDAAEYADLEVLSESSRKDMELYNGIMGYMLERAGYAEDAARRVIDNHWQAEKALAAHMLTREDQNRDDFYERISNVLTLEEVRGIEGSYPMDQILHARGYDVSLSYLVTQPDFWEFLGTEFYTQENVPLIRDYFIGDLCIVLADYLDQDAYRNYNALTNARYGVEGTLPDEVMAADYTDQFLSTLEDNVFIEKYCTPEEKQTVLDMIDGFIEVYGEMLRGEDWLSDATVEKAITKLEKMGRKAIYPDTLPDFSDLEFASAAEGGALLDAIDAIRAYNRAEEVEQIGKAVDPDEWDRSTRVSNAYYNFLDNELVILSGMAMGHFGTDAPYEQVLGALGLVIGHEISHAFDTNGALFDESGALNDWWTEEDYAAFEARTQRVIDYYGQIIPWEGAQAVDGDTVKGEAIADLGGMKAALMLASAREDFDYDLFFRSYAKSWADVYPFDRVEYLLAVDEHPLEYLRVNTVVSQFQEFYDTYDVQPGDGMYLAPADRVSVW